jgi:hypothetical protein
MASLMNSSTVRIDARTWPLPRPPQEAGTAAHLPCCQRMAQLVYQDCKEQDRSQKKEPKKCPPWSTNGGEGDLDHQQDEEEYCMYSVLVSLSGQSFGSVFRVSLPCLCLARVI